MKKKVSELSGAQLDWAVAKCEKPEWLGNQAETYVVKCGFSPSTDWSQGGPIIEMENISIVCAEGEYRVSKSGHGYETYWVAEIGMLCPDTIYGSQGDNWGEYFQIEESAMSGPTPLIAAMRCYVASKLGDEVEIPEALI